jgi:hypothetical protein
MDPDVRNIETRLQSPTFCNVPTEPQTAAVPLHLRTRRVTRPLGRPSPRRACPRKVFFTKHSLSKDPATGVVRRARTLSEPYYAKGTAAEVCCEGLAGKRSQPSCPNRSRPARLRSRWRSAGHPARTRRVVSCAPGCRGRDGAVPRVVDLHLRRKGGRRLLPDRGHDRFPHSLMAVDDASALAYRPIKS